MRSVWLGIPLVLAVQLVAHAAQAQSAAPTAATPSQAITVTGCLQPNPAAPGGSPPVRQMQRRPCRRAQRPTSWRMRASALPMPTPQQPRRPARAALRQGDLRTRSARVAQRTSQATLYTDGRTNSRHMSAIVWRSPARPARPRRRLKSRRARRSSKSSRTNRSEVPSALSRRLTLPVEPRIRPCSTCRYSRSGCSTRPASSRRDRSASRICVARRTASEGSRASSSSARARQGAGYNQS